MTGNSNTSNKSNTKLFNEYFGYLPHPVNGSDVTLAKRDFSESVQTALSLGLKPQELQAILDTILNSGVGAKEVR